MAAAGGVQSGGSSSSRGPLAVLQPSPAAAAAAASLRAASGKDGQETWAPLKYPGPWNTAPLRSSRRSPGDKSVKLTLITPRRRHVELTISVDTTAAELRNQLTECGEVGGIPQGIDPKPPRAVEEVRLLLKGVPLRSDQTLAAQGVEDGAEIRILPAPRSLRQP